MKFDVAVSTRCVIRTASGMSGFGTKSPAFIKTANRRPTARAVSHHGPFIIRITGSATATQISARATCSNMMLPGDGIARSA